jgi:hypothetical protein
MSECVEITIGEMGYSGVVKIAGVDVSRFVTGIKVEAEAGDGLTRVSLDLIKAKVAFEGDADTERLLREVLENIEERAAT